MRCVFLRLKERSYKIIIGHQILTQIGEILKKSGLEGDAVIITNRPIRRLFGQTLVKGLKNKGISATIFEVSDTERSKSVKVAFELIGQIARKDVKKKFFIIAFGGGVIGDLAGFIAAVYKRGIPYVQIPTTFLAQIDSAIGGKVAIDLPEGKNLVGAFYQPNLVVTDISLLATLNGRQIRNGLSEAVKYGVIRDAKLFAYIEKNYKELLACNQRFLQEVVVCCSQIKADVVSKDEREKKGLRTILNFGHTVGHAIEAASQYDRYQHGEAIAIGMRVAADISCQLGLFSLKENSRLNKLLDNVGLPSRIKRMNLRNIIKAMSHDKKFKAKKNRFVLPVRVGSVRIVEGISATLIRNQIKNRQI